MQRLSLLAAGLLASASALALEPGAVFFQPLTEVSVYNGSEGLLVGTNGFRLGGAAAEARLGAAVSGAGDVDGDGALDFIVGAPFSDAGASFRAGRAYVVWGASGVPPDRGIDLASTLAISGSASEDQAGTAVAGGGDFDGDGLDDVALGAPYANPDTGSDAGVVALIYGSTNRATALSLNALNGTNGCLFLGESTNYQAGTTLAFVGDVNGDGRDDLLVGAPEVSTGSVTAIGRAYLLFGRARAAVAATNRLSQLNGTNGVVLAGEDGSDRAGAAVAGLGDFDGDGRRDVVVGARGAGSLFDGRAYVVFGRTNWPAALALAALDGTNGFRFDGSGFFAGFGNAVAGADVNGDGRADLAVGTISQNRLFLLLGTTNRAAVRSAQSLDGTNGCVWTALSSAGSFGGSVARAGFVNFDRFGDLLIGATGQPTNGATVGAGRAYVLMGRGVFAATNDVSSMSGTNGFALAGRQGLAEFGYAVASAGDADGDGLDEVLVGERLHDYGTPALTNAGAAYLVSPLGIAGYVLGAPELASITRTGLLQNVSWESQSGAVYEVYTNAAPGAPWGLAATVTSGGPTTVWESASGASAGFLRVDARR